MCLLDVAVALSGADAVRALHVNYGLRARPRTPTRRTASRSCERLGVALDVHRTARPDDARATCRPGRATSATAPRRGSRRRRAPRARVAAGHTATDQAETILYRLAASPGRRALLGMPARRAASCARCSGITREETAAWCRARGLDWREDATNATDRYARGRVRGGLVPALRALHPAAERNVVRTAELLRDEAEVLDVVVDTALAGRDRIAVEHLAALPPRARAAGRAAPRRAGDRRASAPAPPGGSTTSSRSATARSTSATARAPSSTAACCAASAHRGCPARPT